MEGLGYIYIPVFTVLEDIVVEEHNQGVQLTTSYDLGLPLNFLWLKPKRNSSGMPTSWIVAFYLK